VKAWRIEAHGGASALKLTDLPRPVPAPDEVLVRVRACALNRLDLWVRNGVEGHTFPLPLIPGSEIAGDIESVGSGVTRVESGSPVLLAPAISCAVCDQCIAGLDHRCRKYGILGEHHDGGYAEWISIPQRNVLPLPAGLDYFEAAAIPLVFLTAWHMLVERAQLEPLEDVLIHAAGSGVSTAGIQIASMIGARHIIVTAGSDLKLEKARELGATHTINYNNEDFVARVRQVTKRKGVEVVFDHVGGEIFERSLAALAWAGRIVLCGATADATAKIPLRAVFFKSLSILGSTMGSQSELRQLLRFFDTGRLRPVIDRVFPFDQAPEAQQRLEGREQFGKIVLSMDSTQETDSACSEPI
jgi:NADPH:quinone reductase-like Zn-dependent oxidoreductase